MSVRLDQRARENGVQEMREAAAMNLDETYNGKGNQKCNMD